MTSGRKPKPIEQKIREGNPGKRRLPVPIRTPPGDRLQRPDDLPKEGVELWDEVVDRLDAAGVLDQVDRSALIAMCIQWAAAVRLGRVIKEEGYFATGSTGQLVEHPAFAMQRASHAMFLRFAEQYAITPAARARVAASMRDRGSVDELDAIIGAAPAVIGQRPEPES